MRLLTKYLLTLILGLGTAQAQEMLAERNETPAPEATISTAETGIAKTKEVFLVKDVPQTISFDYEIGEIAVGAPEILSVVADRPRRRVVLSPLLEGETALLVFDTFGKQRDNIQITVTSTDLDQFIRDLRFLLREIEGLTFKRVGRKVVIEGEVFLKADLDRINKLTVGNGEFIVNLVTLSQDTQRILARRVKDEINISGVEVSTVKDKLVLRGEVAKEDESQRAEKIASIYVGADSIVNAISINPKKASARAGKIIQITAYFVELNKSFLRNFNFTFAPTADVSAGYNYSSPGGGRPFFFATVSRFLPSLSTAKALGVARVFENPTVSVKSGEQASVESGTQISLPQRNPNEPGAISFSEPQGVGIKLNVTPAVDDRDFIDLQVDVEASKIGSSPFDGAFSINKSSVKTKHYIRSSETVALGGVMRSAFTELKDAPPNSFSFQPQGPQGPSIDSTFGNIFQIFKARSSTADKTMFIVFITPEVLNSARDSSQKLKDEMNLQAVDPRGSGANSGGLE